jgi:putative N6-adenine-specific DNA methylase
LVEKDALYMSLIQMIAICPDEIKDVLASELSGLGAKHIEQKFKAVHFECDEKTFYRAHLRLRTASRLLRVIKEFSAKDERMLFDQARRVRWSDVFDAKKTFVIEGVPGERGPGVMTSNLISKRVREALQSWFQEKKFMRPKVDLEEPDVELVAFVRAGRCILSVDTSGKSMHKRGYRSDRHPAPIKETMASAMLLKIGYDGSVSLYDPMCGSGTIAIEAASMALGKAALIHRKKGEFGFERLVFFDPQIWRKVQDECRDQKLDRLPAPIFASDISANYIEAAKENALRARVEKFMSFSKADFFNSKPPAGSGILITNLPYGERIKGEFSGDDESFFKAIGDKLKRDFTGWRAAILAAEESPWKFIGLKPTKKIKLLNGSIPVRLLVFDIYQGSKKAPTKGAVDV